MMSGDGRTNNLAPAAHDEMPSPRSKVSKAVSYASAPDQISPIILGGRKDVDDDESFSLDRLNQSQPNTSSRIPSRSTQLTESPALLPQFERRTPESRLRGGESSSDTNVQRREYSNLLEQVTAWLEEEKVKSNARRVERHVPKSREATRANNRWQNQSFDGLGHSSDASDSALALGKLEKIIENAPTSTPSRKLSGRKNSRHVRKTNSTRKLKRKPTSFSSDTEFHNDEPVVPTCKAWLDNTQICSYSDSKVSTSDKLEPDQPNGKDLGAWLNFKFEVVRLTHTLRIKGWRRVPLEGSGGTHVERLSGALTNSIYVVSPPKTISPTDHSFDSEPSRPKKPPPKLLLRIYGPNVSHLIDRDSELAVLRRLARKRIGPRLLGTFTNGRFEEYFHARPLTPQDLRSPETSTQIAKRMRELHDGITLDEREITAGPFVWQNWNKWVPRCETIVKLLDRQPSKSKDKSNTNGAGLSEPVFICGVEWEKFRETVDRYRKWLEIQYGGYDQIQQRLVFAHNDTQYGNILRHVPQGDSPLLLPANEHKQLVVIDFEYANANVPGYEFANHFSEWCYNYHNEYSPHILNPKAYPIPSEQARFLRSYVSHQPQFDSSTLATNRPMHSPTSGSSIPALAGALTPNAPGLATISTQTPSLPPAMLSTPSSGTDVFIPETRVPLHRDSRGLDVAEVTEWDKLERAAGDQIEEEVKRLMHETRLWRAACSVWWVAWGIVQAKLPRALAKEIECLQVDKLEQAREGVASIHMSADSGQSSNDGQTSDPLDKPLDIVEDLAEEGEEGGEESEEDFDYLAYAHDRVLFFWGDMLQVGVVTEEELPEGLRAKVKKLEY